MDIVRHVINGTETAEAARTGQIFDPATGQVTKQVAFASAAEVETAIAAAAAALPGWRETSLKIGRAHV